MRRSDSIATQQRVFPELLYALEQFGRGDGYEGRARMSEGDELDGLKRFDDADGRQKEEGSEERSLGERKRALLGPVLAEVSFRMHIGNVAFCLGESDNLSNVLNEGIIEFYTCWQAIYIRLAAVPKGKILNLRTLVNPLDLVEQAGLLQQVLDFPTRNADVSRTLRSLINLCASDLAELKDPRTSITKKERETHTAQTRIERPVLLTVDGTILYDLNVRLAEEAKVEKRSDSSRTGDVCGNSYRYDLLIRPPNLSHLE
ncbi:hypothetical protein B0H19DRAFT_1065378 [Mycena capillaripes]|nr:hypothetical protein B0H19DRAFT_1065378 [Mycena capillaripes]